MEGVKNETRQQIIMNFYWKNSDKGISYTIDFFNKLDVSQAQVYRAITRVESEELHLQRKGAGALWKLSAAQEKQVVKAMENNIVMTANEGPYATFHWCSVLNVSILHI